MKAVTWIGSFTVRDDSDLQHIRKIDLRPFLGWPGGIDPYPSLDDYDIAQTIVHARKLMIAGRCISSEPLYPGDDIDHNGKRYILCKVTTTRIGHDKAATVCDIEAIHYEATPVTTSGVHL